LDNFDWFRIKSSSNLTIRFDPKFEYSHSTSNYCCFCESWYGIVKWSYEVMGKVVEVRYGVVV